MKRDDFKKIIKLRSCWKIDKRRGNYKLPSGHRLYDYVYELVESQLKVDNLGIDSNGNLHCMSDKYIIIPPFKDYEKSSFQEQIERVDKLVYDIIGRY